MIRLFLALLFLSVEGFAGEPNYTRPRVVPPIYAERDGYAVTSTTNVFHVKPGTQGRYATGRIPEGCQHEFEVSEYVLTVNSDSTDWGPAYVDLEQCAKCGTLRAPVRLKEPK